MKTAKTSNKDFVRDCTGEGFLETGGFEAFLSVSRAGSKSFQTEPINFELWPAIRDLGF